MRNSDKVRAFHVGIGAGHPDSPTVPTEQGLSLREALIDEEYAEVKAAIDALRTHPNPSAADLTDLASELIDLLYVTYGALSALGVPTEQIFGAIHDANMLKLTGPKRADGKQLKPEGWLPADVRGIVAAAAE